MAFTILIPASRPATPLPASLNCRSSGEIRDVYKQKKNRPLSVSTKSICFKPPYRCATSCSDSQEQANGWAGRGAFALFCDSFLTETTKFGSSDAVANCFNTVRNTDYM